MKRLLSWVRARPWVFVPLVVAFVGFEVSRFAAGVSHLATGPERVENWLETMPVGLASGIAVGIIIAGGAVVVLLVRLLFREILAAGRWVRSKLPGQA